MPEIIGLIGVIGSGKTHQRNLLVEKGFVALDFKDELIAMCEDLIGYSIREDYDGFKESIIGMRPLNASEYTRAYPHALTGRRLLQRMGTEVMRKRDPNYWVNAWSRKAIERIGNGFSIACADVRFKNEIEAVWGLGKVLSIPAKVIFCNYQSERYNAKSTHESELLAKTFIEKGLKDLQEVTPQDLNPTQ